MSIRPKSSRPLPPRNFNFGLDWVDEELAKMKSEHHYLGKVVVLNNCSNVKIGDEKATARKKIRIIYDSSDDDEC